MKIVVTGATSMIGVALIKEAIHNNCKVLAIVRKGTSRIGRIPKSDLIEIVYAELETLSTIETKKEQYDVFYHFAWMYTAKVDRDNPTKQIMNICATLQAVELAKKLGCKKFIGAGSQAEYGQVEGIISEKTNTNPTTAYGMSKLAANLLSRKLCEQLKLTHIWGRIFSVYGCNDNEGTMIKYAIDQFINGNSAQFSAATQMWDYVFEDDAGKMFFLLGEKQVKSGIYCIANGNACPLKEYIQVVHRIINSQSKIVFVPENKESVYGIIPDISSTINAISYNPETSFEEGIRKIYQNISRI